MENYIGRLLDNRYEILEIIGNGGMAVVYKALDHRLNRLVAIKILKDDFSRNQEFRRRFHAESQAVAMLSHPNIVSVYDVSRSGDADYIVMELIEGISLKEYLEKKGALNWRETLHFSMQIAKALDHAHSRGIVHRDIKPHNIMILKDGSIKVADFGIARIGGAQNTLTREALGSVHYISPEQAKGSRVDCRSDIYSLGVVMYEMLTGRTPYDGETPVAVAIQHINGVARLPSELVTGIPLGLEQITMHAMNANADMRYASAAEMLRDMEEFRKNPSVTFDFSNPVEPVVRPNPAPRATAAPQNGQPARTAPPVRTGMNRSEAERYAAARNASKNDSRTPEERRQERERRDAERAAEKKRKTIIISVAVAAAVVVVLAIVLTAVLLHGSDSPDRPDASTTAEGNVIVDDFVGMLLEDIDPRDYPDLKVDVTNVKEAYSDKYDEGYVIDQTPKSGDEVRKGRTVTLTVSKGAENNKMPNLSDTLGTDAIKQLSDMQLGLKVETKDEASETITKGYVVRTVPAAGEKLEKNQNVTLYISLGSNKMPKLEGETKENAEAKLKAMELNLRVVFLEEKSEKVEAGLVTRTEPSANSELSKGQQVSVYVSTGDDRIIVPDVLNKGLDTAMSMLKAAGFEASNITVNEVEDPTVDAGKIVSQSVKPETKVEKDSRIVIDVAVAPKTQPPTEAPTEPPTEAPTEAPTAP